MASNRWIGQAVAVREVRHFIPKNIKPGDRFQLSDGVTRYGYTYPSVRPETDETDVDTAQRVVSELLEAAGGSVGLGGGIGGDGLNFSLSSINGIPAVRVEGYSDGRPVSLVATANSAAETPIRIARLREGMNGKSMVFRVEWPTTPTAGKWAVSSDGRKPVILNWDATAAELKSAIESFDWPVGTVAVTGSHSAGYEVTLGGLSEPMKYPPLLFPMVATQRFDQVVDFEMDDESSYRIGGAAYFDRWIETDATAASFGSYLTTVGYSMAHYAQTTVQKIDRPISPGYTPGAAYRLTFKTDEAYEAFMAMPKHKIPYSYTQLAITAADSHEPAFKRVKLPGFETFQSGTRKFRLFPQSVAVAGGTLNPDARSWYSVAVKGSMVIDGFFALGMIKTSPNMSGAFPELVNPLDVYYSHNYLTSSSVSEAFWLDTQISTPSGTTPVTETTHHVFVGKAEDEVPHSATLISGGSFAGLGVDGNAGYKIETLGEPGIHNLVVVLPHLQASSTALYQFEYKGRRSYKFPGVSNRADIKDAAENVFGAGNVVVSVAESGAYQIEFAGDLSEQEVDFVLHTPESEAGAAVSDGDGLVTLRPADAPMKDWVLKYTFTGGVCSGGWQFRKGSGDPVGRTFRVFSASAVTAEDIAEVLGGIDSNYDIVLSADDIEVDNLAVGDSFLMRGFTVTFRAQPVPRVAGSDEVPFWFDLDVSELFCAEPNVSVQSYGRPSAIEMQFVAVENQPVSGQWKLLSGGSETVALAFNASASAVQAALLTIGVSVTVMGQNGGPYRVVWNAAGPQPYLVAVNVSLAAGAAPILETVISSQGTGPHHFNNPDNWSLGRVPDDSDQVIFADGNVSCLYGLVSDKKFSGLDIYRTWTGSLGLPEVRMDGSIETLPCWLSLTNVTNDPLPIRVGLGANGEGPEIVRVSVTGRPFEGNVLYSRAGQRNKAVAVKGTHSKNKLICVNGDVAAGVRPEDIVVLSDLQLVPSNSGSSLVFYAGEGASIQRVNQMGGEAVFGKPPKEIVSNGGEIIANGSGDCDSIAISETSVRWLAKGRLGKAGVPEEIWFGDLDDGIYGDIDGGDAYSTYSGGGGSGATMSQTATEPSGVRFICQDHGLGSGDRIYIRAYSGVLGLDGKIFSVRVVSADAFDLIASQGWGTLLGYEGEVSWGEANAIIVRHGATLDFDSDGQTRDIVAPITVQGSGAVTDMKGTIRDLRLWPEQVDSFMFLGPNVELRRVKR